MMLQQTQANIVVPYYDRFLKRFPDLESLARASLDEIMAFWSGLGYYNRARNLHRAARQIVKRHGAFPEQFDSILALPGVGRYTAGAICSFAFNQAKPVVDGNVRRVLTRLNGIRKRAPESYYWNQMSALLPEKGASSFNQAMMELGALVCVPSQPRCRQCPVESLCQARKLGIQDLMPRPRARRASEHLRIVTLVLQNGNRFLLTSPGRRSLIPGKWGLPYQIVSDRESAEAAASVLCRRVIGRAIPLSPCAQIRHSISRYRILVDGFCGKAGPHIPLSREQRAENMRWAHFSSSITMLTSSLFRKVLQKCRKPS